MDIKELIKEKELISDYTGGTGMIKCSFHNDKSPSMNVNKEGTLFKCFGCGAGGDIFSYLELSTGDTFIEVLKDLAEKHGLDLGKTSDETLKQYSYMQDMQSAFRKQLLECEDGSTPLHFLESRGLDNEAVIKFGIGYGGMNGYDMAKKFQGSDGGHTKSGYFLPANRITFPIHDRKGRVLGFSCRSLDKDQKAKYVNSPGSTIYKKESTLYNFHRAKIVAKEEGVLYVVEGQMDVIQMWAHGVVNVVAACGTAFTDKHVETIEKHLSGVQVVFLFDNDKAGRRATLRALQNARRLYPCVIDLGNWFMQMPCDEDDTDTREVPGDIDDMLKTGLVNKNQLPNMLERFTEEGVGRLCRTMKPCRDKLPLLKKKLFLEELRLALRYGEPILVAEQIQTLHAHLNVNHKRLLSLYNKSEGLTLDGIIDEPEYCGDSSTGL